MKSTTLTNILLAIIVAFMVAEKLPSLRESTDNAYSVFNHTGISSGRDYATGCIYLIGKNGGITPRLDMNGKQVCAETKEEATALLFTGKDISVLEELWMLVKR